MRDDGCCPVSSSRQAAGAVGRSRSTTNTSATGAHNLPCSRNVVWSAVRLEAEFMCTHDSRWCFYSLDVIDYMFLRTATRRDAFYTISVFHMESEHPDEFTQKKLYFYLLLSPCLQNRRVTHLHYNMTLASPLASRYLYVHVYSHSRLWN